MHRRSPFVVSSLCFLVYSGMCIGRNETMAAVYSQKDAKEMEEEREREKKEMLLEFKVYADSCNDGLREYISPPPPFFRQHRRRDIHSKKIPKYSNQKRYVF